MLLPVRYALNSPGDKLIFYNDPATFQLYLDKIRAFTYGIVILNKMCECSFSDTPQTLILRQFLL